MSDYIKATNFATKDTLSTGNPNKIIKGTEIDTEFNSIASAVASKSDINSPTFTGTPAAPTASAGTNTTQLANTAFVKVAVDTATAALGTMSAQNANAVAITGGTITGITDLTVADGGTGVSTIAANAVVLGNGTSAIQTVAPSTNGNVLTSNGTTWTSAALPEVVTSAVAGNGIAVSGATGAVTLSVACPTANTVGSYCLMSGQRTTSGTVTFTFGSNYAAGGGQNQVGLWGGQNDTSTISWNQSFPASISGTWKWLALSASSSSDIYFYGFGCRVS